MGRKIEAMAVAGIVLLLVGCVGKTPIKYTMTDIPSAKSSPSRLNAKVAVLKFADERKDTGEQGGFFTNVSRDTQFETTSISAGISDAIACHIDQTHLFASTVYVDQDCANLSPQVLAGFKEKGFRALLTGKIKRFEGVSHASAFDVVALPMAFLIPVSGAISIPVALVENHDHEGFVTFEDVRLIDTNTAATIWSGNIEKIGNYQFNDHPAKAAQMALREAISEMVQQLEAVEIPEAK